MTAFTKLKALDFYRKIPRDLTEASLSGASLSIIAAVAIIFLFGMELAAYLSISTETTVVVDQSSNGDLIRINFNFSFPSLSCEFASVDVTDVLGTARYNLTKTVRKYPVDQAFNLVGTEHHPDPLPTPEKKGDSHGATTEEVHRQLAEQGHEHVGSVQLTKANFAFFAKEHSILVVNFYAPWCPWCQLLEPAWEMAATVIAQKYNPDTDGRVRMGKVDCTQQMDLCREHHIQGFPSIRIFRSGNDLKTEHGHHDHESYYGERDSQSLVDFVESLVPSAVIDSHGRMALEDKSEKTKEVRRRAPQASGCNIEGFVLVKKVPGNLMVSANSGAHSFDASSMNMTHWVHSFSFGRPLTRRKQGQVERLLPHLPSEEKRDRIQDHIFVSRHDNVTHDHYMQVVLTEVVPLYRDSSKPGGGSLHSYEYTVHSHTLQSINVPVSRFHFELSPMQVLIQEKRRSFSHFITNLCAIIGGVFTVAGIVDSLLHGAVSIMKKQNIGKQF